MRVRRNRRIAVDAGTTNPGQNLIDHKEDVRGAAKTVNTASLPGTGKHPALVEGNHHGALVLKYFID